MFCARVGVATLNDLLLEADEVLSLILPFTCMGVLAN